MKRRRLRRLRLLGKVQTRLFGIRSTFSQLLCGKAVFFTKQTQKDMLGSDVFIGETFGLVGCVLQNALGGSGERQIDSGRFRRSSRQMLVNLCVEGLESCIRQPALQVPVLP